MRKISYWWVITVSFLLLLSLLLVLPAFAKTPLVAGQQSVRYDVYAGGIHALKANLNINAQGTDRYDLSLDAKTYGLLAKMAPWQGNFETRGWQGDIYKPEVHQSIATWRGKKEIKKYSYNKDGGFKSFSVKKEGKAETIRTVDSKLTDGTSDVLTATLNTMRAIAQTGECSGSTEVFDGKRRFHLIFKQKKDVQLEASRWNAYTGPAVECTAEVNPIAGKWHEKPRGWMSIQEQGREKGTMPTVWFAQMKAGEPAIPVKVRVKTSYGTLFMHVTKYEAAGKTLSIKK